MTGQKDVLEEFPTYAVRCAIAAVLALWIVTLSHSDAQSFCYHGLSSLSLQDGITYQNYCLAAVQDVKVVRPGKCDDQKLQLFSTPGGLCDDASLKQVLEHILPIYGTEAS